MYLEQKYLSCITREYKPFWHLSQLGDFAINGKRNLFAHGRNEQPTFFQGTFHILLGKEVSPGKTIGKLRN